MSTLTEVQLAAREGKLTASRVGVLMGGDREKIYRLWQEMIGDPAFVPENYDDVWEVRLGEVTERLNLDWYEKKKGRILTRRGEVVVHPDYQWAAATLDGFDEVLQAPVETKHNNGFEKYEEVVQRYIPQMTWQMECTQTKQCAFSVIRGAAEPRTEIIQYDKAYADEMMVRAHKFMQHVWDLTPPVSLPPVVAPEYSRGREYNMTGNNKWAALAAEWLANKDAAGKFEKAVKEIKEHVPSDSRKSFGHGVVVTRDKAARIHIKAG